jgi:anti-sigma factor RsiW
MNGLACAGFEALIARAADGSLDGADAGRLESHLETCATCREALAWQVEARDLLAARPPLEASASFRARVQQAVRAEADRPQSLAELLDFRRWTWRLAPVAAALGLAAALGVGMPGADDLTGSLSTGAQTELMSDSAAALPVSAALYSTNVTESSLLSMMLVASVDDTLGAFGRER